MDRRMLLAGAGTVALVLLGYSLWPRPSAAPAATDVAFVRAEGAPAPSPVASATARPAPAAAAPAPASADRIPDDPELQQAMLVPDSDPRVLYGRLRAEPIDKPWAEQTQRKIAEAFVPIPYLQRDRSFRIACASTLCEIRGREMPGTGAANTDVIMKALQGERLDDALKALGLDRTSASFGGNEGMEFTIYLKRR